MVLPVEDFFQTAKVDFSKPLDLSILKGQTAIVTGGASGMGLGIGTALAEAGAYVVLADIDGVKGEAAAKELTDKGHNVKFVATDVTSYASQLAAFKFAIAFSPNSTIDIVCTLAGISGGSIVLGAMPENHPPDADPPEPSMRVLNINLYGTFYSTHLAIHYFKKSQADRTARGAPRPQILFMSSLAGYADQLLMGNYAASKWGVRGLFKTVRSNPDDCGGMRANLLAPTFIRTPMTDNVVDGVAKRNIKIGTVADAVDGALRCLSDETVEARAVVIAPGEANGGAPGSANFDTFDDLPNHDAGKEFFRQLQLGTLGEGFVEVGRYTKKSRETAFQSYRSG